MQRITQVSEGYDCINRPCGKNGCGTREGSNHGIHCREHTYAVVSDDGEVAVSLTVTTGVYPDTVDAWRKSDYQPRGIDLSTHCAWPFDREQIKESARGEECGLVRGGRCFVLSSTSWGADVFAADHGVNFTQVDQSETFWKALEERLHGQDKKARDERADTRFARCIHCDGLGTVEK